MRENILFSLMKNCYTKLKTSIIPVLSRNLKPLFLNNKCLRAFMMELSEKCFKKGKQK
jgi:hypothetical protein